MLFCRVVEMKSLLDPRMLPLDDGGELACTKGVWRPASLLDTLVAKLRMLENGEMERVRADAVVRPDVAERLLGPAVDC